jgi:hypothetical protein
MISVCLGCMVSESNQNPPINHQFPAIMHPEGELKVLANCDSRIEILPMFDVRSSEDRRGRNREAIPL